MNIFKWIKWLLWWRELKKLGKRDSLPVNHDDPESYREMFDDGLDPWTALMETMRE